MLKLVIQSPLSFQPRALSQLFALLVTAGLISAPETLEGQQGEATVNPAADIGHAITAPRATAVRLTSPVSVDGRLDELVWGSAPAVTSFTQTDPDEGEPASQRTEVRFAFDASALYVGAMMYDTGEVRTQLARRDGSVESDLLEIVLDSYHDHQTASYFATNPSGIKRDVQVSGGGGDSSWDPVWDVSTQRTEEGWSAEMRIPFSQLRFRPDAIQTWGVQITRTIHRNQEQDQFAFVPSLERSGVQRFGHLEGIRDIRPGQRLELLPYVTGRAEFIEQPVPEGVTFGNSFRDDSETSAGAGLDLKYRLSSNATLDATVNPDFGQVEVDPAVINLSAFETRYQERRPFFIEGAEIFNFGEGGPTGSTGRPAEVLYSRRIGRSPQGSVPSNAVFVEEPAATTILGAGKLTGKMGAGWSLGMLEAVTQAEDARFIDPNGQIGKVGVEPASNYFVARARRDVRDGATRFGAIFTAVNRNFSDGQLQDRLHSAAYTTGVDLVHEWDQRSWRLSGSFSPSLVLGDQAALLRTQQTSTRYLQRPDADHLDVDSTATSLSGYYAMAELNRLAGSWTGRLGLGATSPGYETNDIGFQSYADRLILDTHLQYNQPVPRGLLRNWNVSGGPDNIWNYDGQHVLSNINIQGNYQWINFWSSSWRAEITPETYDDRLTRGGPISRSPRGLLGRLSFNSDSRSRNSLRGSVTYTTDKGGSWSRNASLDFNYRAHDNWSLSVGPNVTRRLQTGQYVTALTDPRATSTFGRRYIFSDLDQTTFSVDTRVNVTFSPTLSFEMYAQPYISSGDYGTPKELSAPGVYDFRVFGSDVGTATLGDDNFWVIDPVGNDPANAFRLRDRDFTFRSLIGNAVLRWEWRPGSTLYFVWQQSREDTLTPFGLDPIDGGIGRVDFTRDARDLFGIRPDNVFAIKVNYWINP